FFFQAEDGIRDFHVTGVQTCALPISVYAARDLAYHIWKGRNFDRMIDILGADHKLIGAQLITTLKLIGEKAPEIVHFEFVSLPRSEERRVGTACRWRSLRSPVW